LFGVALVAVATVLAIWTGSEFDMAWHYQVRTQEGVGFATLALTVVVEVVLLAVAVAALKLRGLTFVLGVLTCAVIVATPLLLAKASVSCPQPMAELSSNVALVANYHCS
jgi:archaellum biogenesis protein FlaJ (TadC family)